MEKLLDKSSSEKPLRVDEALNFASYRTLPQGFWKWLISAFIATYFLSVFIWLFAEIPYQEHLARYAGTINILDGGVQHWSLFSPDVRHIIYHETAIITFQDGSEKIYEFPRMEKLGQWEKFQHEKLRKLFGDCIPWPGYKDFLPSITSYLAACNRDPDNQPVKLTMFFNQGENPPPDPDNWTYRDKLPPHTEKSVTFVYWVRTPDLIDKTANNAIHNQSNLRVVDSK